MRHKVLSLSTNKLLRFVYFRDMQTKAIRKQFLTLLLV